MHGLDLLLSACIFNRLPCHQPSLLCPSWRCCSCCLWTTHSVSLGPCGCVRLRRFSMIKLSPLGRYRFCDGHWSFWSKFVAYFTFVIINTLKHNQGCRWSLYLMNFMEYRVHFRPLGFAVKIIIIENGASKHQCFQNDHARKQNGFKRKGDTYLVGNYPQIRMVFIIFL